MLIQNCFPKLVDREHLGAHMMNYSPILCCPGTQRSNSALLASGDRRAVDRSSTGQRVGRTRQRWSGWRVGQVNSAHQIFNMSQDFVHHHRSIWTCSNTQQVQVDLSGQPGLPRVREQIFPYPKEASTWQPTLSEGYSGHHVGTAASFKK